MPLIRAKRPLRKPKSLESHGVEQVGGVCEGRSGPAFPPEPSTISLSLLPTLRHFPPLVSHGSGNESFQNSQRLQNPALQGGPAHCLWLQTWALRMLLGSLDSSPPWGCFSSTNTPFHQPLPELRLLCAEHSGHPALIMLHVNYCSRHLSLPQGPAHPEDTAPPQSLVHIVG